MKTIILILISILLFSEVSLGANSAQNLKAMAAAARVTNAAALKAKHEAAITRMTALLVGEANKGEEKYTLPDSDQDYALWSAPAGQQFLKNRGFTLTETLFVSGRILEISWVNPTPDP